MTEPTGYEACLGGQSPEPFVPLGRNKRGQAGIRLWPLLVKAFWTESGTERGRLALSARLSNEQSLSLSQSSGGAPRIPDWPSLSTLMRVQFS